MLKDEYATCFRVDVYCFFVVCVVRVECRGASSQGFRFKFVLLGCFGWRGSGKVRASLDGVIEVEM